MFSVFDLKKINTADSEVQEQLIEKLCERFGVARRKFSKLLQRWIHIPAFFEPGDNREIFQEFYNIVPILTELGEMLGREKPRAARNTKQNTSSMSTSTKSSCGSTEHCTRVYRS